MPWYRRNDEGTVRYIWSIKQYFVLSFPAPLAVSDNSALTDIESPEASPSLQNNRMTSSPNVSPNQTTEEIDIVFLASTSPETEFDSREVGSDRRRRKTGSDRISGDLARRKSVRNLVRRRLSSFHEQIPVKIQNFLLKYTLFIFNFMSWVSRGFINYFFPLSFVQRHSR